MKYIVMVQNHWGRGESVYEALVQVKKVTGIYATGGNAIVVYGFAGDDAKVYVNDMGSISWTWSETEMKLDPKLRPHSFEIMRGTIRGFSIKVIDPKA